jgi:hypothetical protein
LEKQIGSCFSILLDLAAGISAEDLRREGRTAMEAIPSGSPERRGVESNYLQFLMKQVASEEGESKTLLQGELRRIFSMEQPDRQEQPDRLRMYLRAIDNGLLTFEPEVLERLDAPLQDWPVGKELYLFHHFAEVAGGRFSKTLDPRFRDHLRQRVKPMISQLAKLPTADPLSLEDLSGITRGDRLFMKVSELLKELGLVKERVEVAVFYAAWIRRGNRGTTWWLDGILPDLPKELAETRKYLALLAMTDRDMSSTYGWASEPELLEMVQWPACQGERRRNVLDELERRFQPLLGGERIGGSYVKFLRLAPSLGIKGLTLPAKRPSYDAMVKEIGGWVP